MEKSLTLHWKEFKFQRRRTVSVEKGENGEQWDDESMLLGEKKELTDTQRDTNSLWRW